jgi:hypothetical protein
MEEKLIKWFIKEMMENDVVFDGDIDDLFLQFGIHFSISGKIDNMNFELNDNVLILECDTQYNMFSNNKYNKNLKYFFKDRKNFEKLYDVILKHKELILMEKNTKQLSEFLENNLDIPTRTIILKSEYDIGDVNFEYIGDSRIDNQKIYKYKKLLPKFEYIMNIS